MSFWEGRVCIIRQRIIKFVCRENKKSMLGISSYLAVAIAIWRLNPKRIWQQLIENTYLLSTEHRGNYLTHFCSNGWGQLRPSFGKCQTACCVLINVEQYLLSSWLQGHSSQAGAWQYWESVAQSQERFYMLQLPPKDALMPYIWLQGIWLL